MKTRLASVLACALAASLVASATAGDAPAPKTLVFKATSWSSGTALSLDAASTAAAVVVKRCAHAGIEGVTSGLNAKGDAVEIRLAPSAVEREATIRRFIERPGLVEFRIHADTAFEDEWRERKLEGVTTPPPGFAWCSTEDGTLALLVEKPEAAAAAKVQEMVKKGAAPDAPDVVAAMAELAKTQRESVFTNADVAEATVDRSISTHGAATHLRVAIRFSLREDRRAAFETFTGGHVGRGLAIVVDGKVHVCPAIKAAIPGEGKLIGPGTGYTDEAAQEFAALLASGPLPCRLVEEKK